jgi:hypothetical protein
VESTDPSPTGNADDAQTSGLCICDRQTLSHGETEVYFSDLNPSACYAASVARTEVCSLFGITAGSVSPSAQSSSGIRTSLTANPTHSPNPTTRIVSPGSEGEDTTLPNISERLDDGGIESPTERDSPVDSVNRQQVDASFNKGLNQSDVERQLAFEEDMKTWDSWNGEALRLSSSQSTLTPGMSILVCGSNTIMR